MRYGEWITFENWKVYAIIDRMLPSNGNEQPIPVYYAVCYVHLYFYL